MLACNTSLSGVGKSDGDDQKDAGYPTESKGKWIKETREGLDKGVEVISSFPF